MARHKSLYKFWGTTITETLNEAMRETRSRVLVNLASKEYFGAVDPERLDGTVITPTFKERKDGTLRL